MPDADGYATALEQLADYECPECGPLTEDALWDLLTEDDAMTILGGDEHGFLRCPNEECGEELELTAEASAGMLAMVAERFPELGPNITAKLGEIGS